MLRNLLSLLLTTVFLVGCTSAPEIPANGSTLPACGPLPNCVNSESGEGGQAIDPIRASEQQWRSLKRWLKEQTDWTITREDSLFLQAVTTTPTLRFRDDVQLRYDPNQQVIHARSSSRLGIGDMGANRSRVESLRLQIADLDSGNP